LEKLAEINKKKPANSVDSILQLNIELLFVKLLLGFLYFLFESVLYFMMAMRANPGEINA